MLNKREMRISILYFLNAIILVGILILIKNYHLLDSNTSTLKDITVIIVTAFSFLAIIPCVAIAISHLNKSRKYCNLYDEKNICCNWKYNKIQWNKFIINNFKINMKISVKSSLKAALKFHIIAWGAILVYIFISHENKKNSIVYLLIPPAVYIVISLVQALKSIISTIDHLIFTNRSVVITPSMAIVNDEIHPFDVPQKSELQRKKINEDNLEIYYAVPSQSSGRFDNMKVLLYKDIKKLVIPIPNDKVQEARKYIRAPYPIK